MTLSYALENSLRGNTFQEGADRWYNPARRPPCYENHGVFSKFLEVILPYDGECFIPVLGLENTICMIQAWFDSVSPTQPMKVSYPLFVGGAEAKRTADSIIQSINKCPSNLRLSRITTSKGLDYYGGQGLIFDEHWTPMMLCGYIVNIDRLNRTIRVIKPVCYVSPTVFENNDLLSKAIIKKVIPYLSSSGANAPNLLRALSYVTFNSNCFGSVPVTICYLDSYFVTPHVPGDFQELDDHIWNFLNENITEVV